MSCRGAHTFTSSDSLGSLVSACTRMLQYCWIRCLIGVVCTNSVIPPQFSEKKHEFVSPFIKQKKKLNKKKSCAYNGSSVQFSGGPAHPRCHDACFGLWGGGAEAEPSHVSVPGAHMAGGGAGRAPAG